MSAENRATFQKIESGAERVPVVGPLMRVGIQKVESATEAVEQLSEEWNMYVHRVASDLMDAFLAMDRHDPWR